jgi:3-oxoacyl-[acyl-carrier protein] reductase
METVWITGATGAIGSALARRFDARGVNVVLSARDSGELEALAAELSPGALSVVADATDASSSPNVLKIAEERFEPVTGLAHCVGSILIKPLHLTTAEELDTTTTQNYLSAWHVLRAFVIAQLKHREHASAVLVGTVATRSGFANHEAIAGAKAAVAALAASAAATYADRNIRINCVHPGLTASAMSAKFMRTTEAAERMAKLNPMGRLGTGDNTAALIEFLLSKDAGWITGQQIGVDGGHGALQHTVKA